MSIQEIYNLCNKYLNKLYKIAPDAGIEPATSILEVLCAIQLRQTGEKNHVNKK